MESQTLIPALPDDLSLEILKKLPTKSLLRFSIISKTWNSIISSTHFTKSHLLVSLSDPNYSHHHLLFTSRSYSTTAFHFPLSSLTEIVPQGIPYPIQDLIQEPSLIGSINGLVCIATNEPGSETQLILWNPSIRKSRTLPKLHSRSVCTLLEIAYGFGYDSSAQDYKVLAIFTLHNKKHSAFENYIEVYSQNTDSWKSIQGFNLGRLLDDSGIFVNGKLHWIGPICCNRKNDKVSIVFVDVGGESYGVLDQPSCGEGKFYPRLGVWGKELCVLWNYDKVKVDFWVVKEYGVTESWTKFASITAQNLDRMEISPYSRLFYVLDSGEILLLATFFVI